MVDRAEILTITGIELLTQREQLMLAALIEIADASGSSGVLADILDAIEAQGTITLSTEGTSLQIEANLDDTEQLSRDLARLIGTLGADTGGTTYDSGAGAVNITTVDNGDNTATMTITGDLGNWESVVKAGDTITTSGGAASDGTHLVAAVDDLTITVFSATPIAHGGIANLRIIVLDTVNANSVLGRVISLRTTRGDPVPSTVVVIGGEDASGDVITFAIDANGDLRIRSTARPPTSPTPQTETNPTAAGSPYDHNIDTELAASVSIAINNATDQTVTYDIVGSLDVAFTETVTLVSGATLLTNTNTIHRLNNVDDFFTDIGVIYTFGSDATGTLTTTPKLVIRGT